MDRLLFAACSISQSRSWSAQYTCASQPEAIQAMATPVQAYPARDARYARGWMVSCNCTGSWWQSGSLPGLTALMVHNPDSSALRPFAIRARNRTRKWIPLSMTCCAAWGNTSPAKRASPRAFIAESEGGAASPGTAELEKGNALDRLLRFFTALYFIHPVEGGEAN